MLEFRISGETAKASCLADQLERAGYVVRRSKPYRNRDEEGCRIYLELDEDKVMGWMLANLEKAYLDNPSQGPPFGEGERRARARKPTVLSGTYEVGRNGRKGSFSKYASVVRCRTKLRFARPRTRRNLRFGAC